MNCPSGYMPLGRDEAIPCSETWAWSMSRPHEARENTGGEKAASYCIFLYLRAVLQSIGASGITIQCPFRGCYTSLIAEGGGVSGSHGAAMESVIGPFPTGILRRRAHRAMWKDRRQCGRASLPSTELALDQGLLFGLASQSNGGMPSLGHCDSGSRSSPLTRI